jgi:hypothetical protein
MAAPHVAGAIALLFSYREKQRSQKSDWKQFNAEQIRKAIWRGSQNYTGQWNPGFGWGILDVELFFHHLKL